MDLCDTCYVYGTGRWMMQDDGRKLITIGYLSDSVDVKYSL